MNPDKYVTTHYKLCLYNNLKLRGKPMKLPMNLKLEEKKKKIKKKIKKLKTKQRMRNGLHHQTFYF